MKYETAEDIYKIVRAFENGTITRERWRHAEHLTVALFYVWHHDFDAALDKMRAGIFNLLRAFAVDLTKEMPYHETLTVFWTRTVLDFKDSKNGAPIHETCNELIEHFDKDYPLKFYSRQRLFSDQARAKFVEADIKNAEAS
jgi:hypothetical protein